MNLGDLLLKIHKGKHSFSVNDTGMTPDKFELILELLEEAEDSNLIAKLDKHIPSDGSHKCDLAMTVGGLTPSGREFVGVS